MLAFAMEKPGIGPIRIAHAGATDFRAATSPFGTSRIVADTGRPTEAASRSRATSSTTDGTPPIDVRASGSSTSPRGPSASSRDDSRAARTGLRAGTGWPSASTAISRSSRPGDDSSGRSAAARRAPARWPGHHAGDLIAAVFGRDVLLITPERTVVQTIVRPKAACSASRRSQLVAGRKPARPWRRRHLRSLRAERQGLCAALDDGGGLPRAAVDLGRHDHRLRARARLLLGVALRIGDLTGQRRSLCLPRSGEARRSSSRPPPRSTKAASFSRPARGGGTAGTAARVHLRGDGRCGHRLRDGGRRSRQHRPRERCCLRPRRNDLIVGGKGKDALYGGGGSDEIWGDGGNDRIYARDRRSDRVLGGLGRDRAWVDPRRDIVKAVETVYPPRKRRR